MDPFFTSKVKLRHRPPRSPVLAYLKKIVRAAHDSKRPCSTLMCYRASKKNAHAPDWRVKYNRARKDCAEYWVSEIVPMSDAVIGEEMNVVTATRNAVDARKWVAGKLAPREYGDQPAGVTINNTTNVAIMTDDRLRALQETRKRLFLEQAQAPTLPA
jgi:hypothetical protein